MPALYVESAHRSCCRSRAKPGQFSSMEGRAKWMAVYQELRAALMNGHADCLYALLTIYGNNTILNKPIGEDIVQKITKEYEEFDDSSKALETLLEFGVKFERFLKLLRPYDPWNEFGLPSNPAHDPILIGMKHDSEEIIAILRQKAGEGFTQQRSKDLHAKVLSYAVKEVDTVVVSRLVEAGTDKQELLRIIEAQRVAQTISDSDAQQLRSVVRTILSLGVQCKIVIWSKLSCLDDASKLNYPRKNVIEL